MKKRTIKTLKALKKILKKTLPEKISKVLESYDNFSEKNEPDDIRSFGAYHTALKAAIVHAQTLLKLADSTSEKNEFSTEGEQIEWLSLLQEADELKKSDEEDEDEES